MAENFIRWGWFGAWTGLREAGIACRNWPGRNFMFISAMLIMLHIYSIEYAAQTGNELVFLHIDAEGSVSEFWETVLLTLAAVVYIFRAAGERCGKLMLPALLLIYMAFDGSMQWHEAAGEMLYPPNPDYGEPVFMIAVCIAAGAAMLWALVTAEDHVKRELWAVTTMFAIFAFFSIIMDAFHVGMRHFVDPRLDVPLGMLEDGGELFAISALAALATSVVRRGSMTAAQRRDYAIIESDWFTRLTRDNAPVQRPQQPQTGRAADG
ncbi:hypothetical protein [Croceicoccus mobilis]|uniref:Uncharacterized protein n=1 Tax=Croceicoccus mobilis TaxID=1703339 RepID=A0A916YWY0_9SPHN|nr:hypothetical protein [Croceicoccus mobilis]GGD65166.1 hypothetical protein GCM10010990_13340 [Croceicoccus mobilis]